MVHALNEIWRVTRNELLDIRPLAMSPSIYVRDRIGGDTFCGDLTWCDESGHHHIQSDTALARVISAGKFEVTAQDQFNWFDTFETTDELVAQVHDDWITWTVDEDAALKLMRTMESAGQGAIPYLRQGIGVRLLKKIDE